MRKYGEVFTPEWVVKKMCDMLEAENPEEDVFAPWTTFLEPTCGDGAFVAEILRRKFERCKCRADYRTALESVYGFEIQAENVKACIQNVISACEPFFKPTKADVEIINDHIIQCDGLKVMRMLNHAKS